MQEGVGIRDFLAYVHSCFLHSAFLPFGEADLIQLLTHVHRTCHHPNIEQSLITTKPSTMPGSIAVIGSLNIDFITRTPRVPAGGETLEASSSDTGFGGKGANQAVACARLSRNSDGSTPADSKPIKVSMVGFVGEDSFGSDFISAMKETFIDTTHIQKVAGQKTGIANIIVEEKTGENRILFCPNANFSGAGEVKDLVPEDADVVVFQLEMPLAQVVHNIKLAHSKGKYV